MTIASTSAWARAMRPRHSLISSLARFTALGEHVDVEIVALELVEDLGRARASLRRSRSVGHVASSTRLGDPAVRQLGSVPVVARGHLVPAAARPGRRRPRDRVRRVRGRGRVEGAQPRCSTASSRIPAVAVPDDRARRSGAARASLRAPRRPRDAGQLLARRRARDLRPRVSRATRGGRAAHGRRAASSSVCEASARPPRCRRASAAAPAAPRVDGAARTRDPPHEDLGARGRRLARGVGDLVGHAAVDLVPDAGDHRDRHRRDRPRHELGVERREVGAGPAAADEHHHVDSSSRRARAAPTRSPRRGRALHADVDHHHLERVATAPRARARSRGTRRCPRS